MSLKLRELIRSVRSCKTAAEERAVISKECAAIRTSLKEGAGPLRARNVAKLMYIHMLGYPTQFGQMECITLVTSDKYAEKRVGYLGLMVLLDERQEVLTLVENHLKKDLHDSNQYIQGLALCTIANISSDDMSHGVSAEILTLLSSSNPYIKKKAALCALRIIRKLKTADVIDMYLDSLSSNLLNERNHGVLITTIVLVIEALQTKDGQKFLPVYRKLVPVAVRMLKNLVMSSYALEHDINGVADPFLQVRLLQLLRVLGTGDAKSSDQMNDVLAQVATNTESTKNCGNAILYECVLTVVALDADPGLRVLAINILGRFLVNRDNNIRYVALNTLTKVVSKDLPAVQRHKNTIVDCLKDVDISIRRRALDLIYTLVNSSNIRLLVPDLISYLSFANNDFKEDLTTKICFVVERYAPNRQWHIDTLIKVLTLAGSYVPESVGNKLMALISQSDANLQCYCVKVLWGVMAKNAPLGSTGTCTLEGSEEDAAAYCRKETLLQVSLWCVGEYCDLLCDDSMGKPSEADDAQQPDWQQYKPAPIQVSNVISALLTTHYVTGTLVKQHALTALLKLSARFPEVREQARQLYSRHSNSQDIEIQQRAFEFCALLDYLDLCPNLLDRMPPVEITTTLNEDGTAGVVESAPMGQIHQPSVAAVAAAHPTPASPTPAVSSPMPGLQQQATVAAAPAAPAPTEMPDIFDIFGPNPTVAQPPSGPSTATIEAILNAAPATFPMGGAPAAAAPQAAGQQQVNVFRSADISIDFTCSKGQGSMSDVLATITNVSAAPLHSFSFLAAVPKYAKLNILPLSDTAVQSGGRITVAMQVDNPSEPHKAVMMRLKPKYINGLSNVQVEEDVKVSNLPAWI